VKSSLRPTTIEDLNAVRQFLRRVFNTRDDAPFINPSVMHWKYWDARGDWDGPRAYVLERDGAIVAHAGIYPVCFESGQVNGIEMIDWASANDAPGAGLVLMRKLAAMFDFIYSIGGSDMAHKILPAAGFVEFARQWRGARPLQPWPLVMEHQYRNWKLAPRLVRNTYWAVYPRTNNRFASDWQFEEISPSEIGSTKDYENVTSTRFSPRPSDFFCYLLRCPVMKMRIYRLTRNLKPAGHFAIGVVRGQARLAGVWLHDPNQTAWQAAFSLAHAASLHLEGVREFIAAGTAGTSEQGAVSAGLRIRTHTPVYLLNKGGNARLNGEFQFQLADDDALFMDLGGPNYWT